MLTTRPPKPLVQAINLNKSKANRASYTDMKGDQKVFVHLMITVPKQKTQKYFNTFRPHKKNVFLYCDHQVHRNFLITLYHDA
jgi:hypothetical protein